MDQLTKETAKKVYVQPLLEKREHLAEVTEGLMLIATTGKIRS
jgi:hypothetical protein